MKRLFLILSIGSLLLILSIGLFINFFGGSLINLSGAEISGQGFLKTRDGDVKTCSGNKVYLEKYNDKQKGYIMNLHDYNHLQKMLLVNKRLEENINEAESLHITHRSPTTKKAARESIEAQENKLKEIEKQISSFDKKHIKETTCDAQGNFEFYDIAPGKYRVGTTVEWMVGDEKHGGFIDVTFELPKKQNKMRILLTDPIKNLIEAL